MMHPQAVMMSQTGVSGCLLAAIRIVLGPKANGMSLADLNHAIDRFLQKQSTADLIRALPYGQRDSYHTNAALLERHAAVTMANLADTLVGLKLVRDRNTTGDRVLAEQAKELAVTYHLADSAAAELKRLKQQRAAQQARIARYLHGQPARG